LVLFPVAQRNMARIISLNFEGAYFLYLPARLFGIEHNFPVKGAIVIVICLGNRNKRERLMKEMNINERKLNDVTVFDLDGSFVLGGDGKFRQSVTTNIDGGGRKLIVNLAKVSYMDSSGLGELISCYTQMERVSGHMKLINLNSRLNQLLVVTKLITVFETFDSESAAISSFAS
jgi:anti-sigma B factor antagonist